MNRPPTPMPGQSDNEFNDIQRAMVIMNIDVHDVVDMSPSTSPVVSPGTSPRRLLIKSYDRSPRRLRNGSPIDKLRNRSPINKSSINKSHNKSNEPLIQCAQKCAWCNQYMYFNDEIEEYKGLDVDFIGWMVHKHCNKFV